MKLSVNEAWCEAEIRRLANVLQIRGTVRVVFEDDMDDSWASCSSTYGRAVHTLTVSREVFGLPEDEAREILVHELLHAVHYRLTQQMEQTMQSSSMNRVECQMMEAVLRTELEHMVDQLAHVLAPRI